MELVFLALLMLLMATALGSGFPVAFALPGSAILSIGTAALAGYIFAGDPSAYFAQGGPVQWLTAGITNFRGIYWEVERDTLIAIPLFIFMGIMLQRSKIAEDLLIAMAQLFGPVPGGLGISVVFVGALLAATTGIVDVSITGADSGNYVFIDAETDDNQITLGNGVATQTIDIGPAIDTDGAAGAIVATGSSIIANFDRLGIQLTLSGQRPPNSTSPAIDGYRDGELDGLTLNIESGIGGSFQIGPKDGAVHRLEVNITDMRATGVNLNLGGLSVSTLTSSRSAIS